MSTKPRVWLAGTVDTLDPVDRPTVRDGRMRTWQPGDDGRYHTADGWHDVTWRELHHLFDLVEVVKTSCAGDDATPVCGTGYQPPIHSCAAGCGTPTAGVFCLSCATS